MELEKPSGSTSNDPQAWARLELKARIAESGLSVSRFSRERLIRDPSTIYRYLSGTGVIPRVVCEWLLGNWRFLEVQQAEDSNEQAAV